MDVWNWVLFGGAAFVAFTSLVILMLRRRDEVFAELEAQGKMEQERQRREAHDENQRQKSQRAA